MLDYARIAKSFAHWQTAKPFSHAIVDDFFERGLAGNLSAEFPDFDSPIWHEYNNPLECKKVSNAWDLFPASTYQVFNYLNSNCFIAKLAEFTNIEILLADNGLNGGGWHIHAQGGRLNPHLDYSMHPKLPYQRKVNMLCYLNPNWHSKWGGHLGLYARGGQTRPGKLVRKITPKFNRAVFFDTTMTSWHGLCEEIICPKNEYRKSIALYYLTNPPTDVDPRGKALFAPTKKQNGDPAIEKLIQLRADSKTASTVYKK